MCLLLTINTVKAAQTCPQYLSLSEHDQNLFVSGMVDGMGGTLGVWDTVAKHLKQKAASNAELDGISNMHLFAKNTLDKGGIVDLNNLPSRIKTICQRKQDYLAGNALIDIFMGLD